LTYGSQGIPKNGVHSEHHAVICTSRHAEYRDKGSTNRKDIHCPKCCQNCSARGDANADSAVDPCPDCTHAHCVSCEDRLTEQSAMPLRHLHYNKAHIVEHNLKVCFMGSMDQANVDQLFRGNPAWVQSDAGENIPVFMEEQTCSCLTCRRRHFLIAENDKVPKKMAALLAISSGVLMSSSFVWLNTWMDLYEPSVIMKKVVQVFPARLMLTVVVVNR